MQINLDPSYFRIPYNGAVFPGSGHQDLELGANCQVFAYAVLADHGLRVPPLRSSELWADQTHTRVVEAAEWLPLDLIFLHSRADAFGAHVGVYVGEGAVLHLTKHHGWARVEAVAALGEQARYRCLIGGKRVR